MHTIKNLIKNLKPFDPATKNKCDNSDLIDVLSRIFNNDTSSAIGLSGDDTIKNTSTQEKTVPLILHQHNIKTIPTDNKIIPHKRYYIQHINGSQKTPDLTIISFDEDNHPYGRIDIELKSSKTNRIMMNDGFFKSSTIYIIKYVYNKKPSTMIAFGSDIPTEQEISMYNQVRDDLKSLRFKYKDVGTNNFGIYPRLANFYQIDFSYERIVGNFENAISRLRAVS